MVEFRWIKMSLFLMLVLHFTAAATRQLYLSSTVRAGDDVTLSCENVINDQNNCGSTTWLFSGSRSTAAVELVTLGQIGKDTNSKSDRLSVTANCSLVIKKVTVEDVGRYTCRQFISGQQQGPDSLVYLSVITSEDTKPTTTIKPPTTTTTTTTDNASTELKARTDWSVLNYIMLVMRVAELLLITVITVLLIRARGFKLRRKPSSEAFRSSSQSGAS
ncbi:uncharacterized protein LOC127367995 isoform X7 [Dicentrarchus labrax]|uniref:uncharacterized protein LOC127367995 isoform X7 n=1 Tax=Dicentrarchus labrax TaxID=13489 RepID=UPI0021F51BCE|nr:uncharacterized protein LOC127367995 isoform X7 [Dicentrarchus labrax]